MKKMTTTMTKIPFYYLEYYMTEFMPPQSTTRVRYAKGIKISNAIECFYHPHMQFFMSSTP